MPTQRERTWNLLLTCGGVLIIGVILSALAETVLKHGWFYIISTFVYATGAVISLAAIVILLAHYAHAYWLENKVTSNMISVDSGDLILENWRIGETLVRSPVVGVSTQVLTIAPPGHTLPTVHQNPIHLTHIAGDLPIPERLSDEAYRQFVELLHKSSKEE